MNFGIEREKHGPPIAARIGFRDGAANCSAVAHLRIGDSGGAIMKDRHAARDFGVFDVGVARHRAEMNCPVGPSNV